MKRAIGGSIHRIREFELEKVTRPADRPSPAGETPRDVASATRCLFVEVFPERERRAGFSRLRDIERSRNRTRDSRLRSHDQRPFSRLALHQRFLNGRSLADDAAIVTRRF